MANCFFVDFENVHNAGLSNLKGLSKDDFFLFFTQLTLRTLHLITLICSINPVVGMNL